MNRALIERTLAAMDKGYMGHHHAEYAAVMEALKAELAANQETVELYDEDPGDRVCNWGFNTKGTP